MKKLTTADICCTIEQGKRLDELLDRVGKYEDNLFHHTVFCSDGENEKPLVEVLYNTEINDELNIIVCNAYCDAELDQLLPGEDFQFQGKAAILKHFKVDDLHNTNIETSDRRETTINYTGQICSAQSKAQCLIWLIENTGYRPQIKVI